MFEIYKHNFLLDFGGKIPEGFLGPVLRGGIGSHLRKFLSPEEYEFFFNTPPDGKIMRRYPEVPKGYVIDIPYTGQVLTPLALVLLPRTQKLFDALNRSIHAMAGKNGFSALYQGCDTITSEEPRDGGDEFRIIMETPVHLVYKGKCWVKPELHILVRNMVRRLFVLGHYYCEDSMDVDKTLVNDAEKVELVSDRVSSERIVRFSTRKRREMALTGLIGSCLYRFPSNVDRERKKSMLRLIKQFEALHVGKHTSFGLGKITLLQDGENKGGMHEKGTGN